MKDSKTCKICFKTFTRRNYMLKHMENIHAKRYSCSICSRFFPGPTEHACAVPDGRFVCYVENCALRFGSGMTLRLHIRDGHKNLDENKASANFKTKKGARDFVKTLCKSINMLSICFDELKYQVETMADFMKTLGYESQSTSSSSKEKQKIVLEETHDYEELNKYIDFLDEELIEVHDDIDENADEDMLIEDEREQFIEQPKQEMIIKDFEEFIENSMPVEKPSNNPTFIFPKKHNEISIISENINQQNTTEFVELEKTATTTTTTTTTLKRHLSTIDKNTKFKKFPTAVKIGSTIIKPLPIKMDSNSKNHVKTNNNPNQSSTTTTTTTSSSIEQSTPPLFLKIQYDNAETEVCKADPKITFHFDTRPPDEEKEEFINSK